MAKSARLIQKYFTEGGVLVFNEIWSAATNLPVIFQGALGSALFAIIVWLGQKIFVFIKQQMSRLSQSQHKRYVGTEIMKLTATLSTETSER